MASIYVVVTSHSGMMSNFILLLPRKQVDLKGTWEHEKTHFMASLGTWETHYIYMSSATFVCVCVCVCVCIE